ncbi:MAG: DUF58 domain-containing protein, partial [Pontixanthobacter sp.]
MRFPIVPTARAAWLTALAAPLAIVIAATAPAAWIIVPAAAAALLVMVLLDGLLAGRLDDWRIVAPADCEVGEPVTISGIADFVGRSSGALPEMALQVDERLDDDGRLLLTFRKDGETDSWQGAAHPEPSRRGTAFVTRMWLRWSGPLG